MTHAYALRWCLRASSSSQIVNPVFLMFGNKISVSQRYFWLSSRLAPRMVTDPTRLSWPLSQAYCRIVARWTGLVKPRRSVSRFVSWTRKLYLIFWRTTFSWSFNFQVEDVLLTRVWRIESYVNKSAKSISTNSIERTYKRLDAIRAGSMTQLHCVDRSHPFWRHPDPVGIRFVLVERDTYIIREWICDLWRGWYVLCCSEKWSAAH